MKENHFIWTKMSLLTKSSFRFIVKVTNSKIKLQIMCFSSEDMENLSPLTLKGLILIANLKSLKGEN